MKYEKIIFLDFDGVLNNWDYENPWMGTAKLLNGYTDRDEFGLLFDTGCVARLETVVEKTGAGIVLISSWRHEGLPRMQEMWHVRQLPGELVGIAALNDRITTGSLDSPSRGDIVKEWLDGNETGNYVIIDDTDDFLRSQRRRLILPDYDIGFTESDMKKAIKILEK